MDAAANDFMKDFIAKEADALKAKYTEPNPSYIPKLQAVNALFSRDVTTKSGISRSSSPNLDELRPRGQSVVARRVLSSREISSPAEGTLFEFVLTAPEAGADKAEAKYYVRQTDAGMRIASYYTVCRDCSGTGKLDGKSCPMCRGSGWNYADGLKL